MSPTDPLTYIYGVDLGWSAANAGVNKAADAISGVASSSATRTMESVAGLANQTASPIEVAVNTAATAGTSATAAGVKAVGAVSGVAKEAVVGTARGIINNHSKIGRTLRGVSAPVRGPVGFVMNEANEFREKYTTYDLPQGWDRKYGKRLTLSKAFGFGAALGLGMAAFKLSAEDNSDVARRVEAGSAYESGAGNFGHTARSKARMPSADGRMTMGLHNRR